MPREKAAQCFQKKKLTQVSPRKLTRIETDIPHPIVLIKGPVYLIIKLIITQDKLYRSMII